MKIYILLIFITITLFAGEGIGEPFHDISVGPSFGYINNGYSASFELSHTYRIITSSLVLRYIDIDEKDDYAIQYEFCVWEFINLGIGIGYLLKNETSISNLFIGIPVPMPIHGESLKKVSPFYIFYIEPYYRLNYFNDNYINEFGLLFKVTTYDYKNKRKKNNIYDW